MVVGLGANLGDRQATLVEAARRIAARARVVAGSHSWETAPIGPPQPDYLNAAIAIDWNDSARALLDVLQAIEKDLGRERTVRFGPRTIDLDILWIDGLVVDEPDLVVPHPRLHERAFAVAPLLEVAPDAPYQVPAGEVRVRPELGVVAGSEK